MKTTRIILAGGFLGAGKTTLLWNAAQNLMRQGLRVGLITNDQAPELVDSALLSLNDLKVTEVSGSCFCCNFNGFTDAIQKIQADASADVIIAEPVGSCTDLSATIIQPLKQYWNSQITVSPLTVLADPSRLTSILGGEKGGLHEDAAYIFRKQLEESDIILINKADQLNTENLETLKQCTMKAYPSATVLTVSALSGDGVDEWLNLAMSSKEAGKRIVAVDYDIYAHGEAVLGWLNGTVRLRQTPYGKAVTVGSRSDITQISLDAVLDENARMQDAFTDWDAFVRTFLKNLSQKFDDNNLAVGHVKVIAENGARFVVGNLTGTGDTLSVRGSAGNSDSIKMIINARVETSPEELDKMLKATLSSLAEGKYETEILAWRYLQPGRPEPTHRFSEVV